MKNVEDIFPLSPVQQGMLFQTLLSPRSGAYFTQLGLRFDGPLDAGALERAWQRVVERHAIFRAAILWEGLEQPLHVVRRTVKVPWELVDMRGLSPEAQRAEIDRLVEADRAQGFNLTQAPLLRFHLLRLEDAAHELLWSSHHLLMDGWSVPLLLEEVLALYAAFARGREPRDLPRRRPYRDYIAWLKQQDAGPPDAYWREALAGFRHPTSIGRRGAAGEEEHHAEERALLSSGLTDSVAAFARQHQLTLATVFEGVWAALLARYTGQRDVMFGATVSGRSASLPGVQSMVGLFINTLPVRAQIDPGVPAIEWLEALQAEQVRSRQWEHVPLSQIQALREVPKGTYLFDSIFVFENYPTSPLDIEGLSDLRMTPHVFSVGRTEFPLTIVVEPNERLGLRVFHNRSFSAGDIRRMLGHIETLLRGLVEDPRRSLDSLPILSEEERRQIVVEWNATEAPYPERALAHTLFEEAARRSPDATALELEGATMSFRELDRRANRLAHALRARGVGPEVLVAVLAERSFELVIAILAVLKAGGAYLPLDPAYPRERLGFVLEDARARAVLTQERLVERLPEGAPEAVLLDRLPPDGEDAGPDVRVSPDNLAYVIYTSGSTGRPKGAMIHHRGLVNYLAWARTAFGMDGPGARGAPVQSSIGFDLTVTSLVLPLVAGKSVLLLPEGNEVEALAQALCETPEPFALVKITPAHLEILRHQVPPERAPLATRAFVIGGEILRAEAVEFWRAHAPATRLINEYGSTENTVGTVIYDAPPGVPLSGVLPAGKPIANSSQYVLDARLQPVPVGVLGEVYIGGVGVCRGYLNRPDLTAERFLPDPFSAVPGARFYKLGDVGRLLPDGNVEVLGRTDAQVKIRGYRVELGEIEAAVGMLPGVRDVAVLAREDAPGDRRIVAYVVPHQGAALDEEELSAALRKGLPEYMVPSAFVLMDAFPLTTNGKIDRRALPAPAMGHAGQEVEPPETPVEQALAAIWAEVLRVEGVGRRDHFFELGGHSLLATQVISRVRKTFEIEAPLRWLFEAPELAELAGRIERARAQSARAEARREAGPELRRYQGSEPAPLSFAQQRLWILEQLEPGTSVYNVPRALRARGPLRARAFDEAFAELARRHEALRAAVPARDGGPAQVILPAEQARVEHVDLSALDPARREAEALRLAETWSKAPFDLGRGPLARAHVARLGPEDHLIVLAMHHIVCDGWSEGILERELCELYAAFAEGRPSPLPAPALQYSDFARWQREWLASGVLEEQLAYWRAQLGGKLPVLALPTDRPRPARQTSRGRHALVDLPRALGEALRGFARREGVTHFMALLAAFAAVLHRCSGQQDLLIGSPIAGRNRAELEGIVGFFVNTLVLRVRAAGSRTFRELAAEVRRVALDAYAHQDVPFERLVEVLEPERDPGRSPLFQVLFHLENSPREALTLPGVALEPVLIQPGTSKFDLGLSLIEEGDQIGGSIEYREDLFDAETIERFVAHFVTLASAAFASPDTPLRDLPLVTGEEQEELLAASRRRTGAEGVAALAPCDCLSRRFERRAAEAPAAIAVTYEEASLTYDALNRRANRLARRLRALGVGREARVGVLLERSLDLPVALLAVLKAGGAYVPLDPAYPDERVAYIVEDSRVPVVVTCSALAGRLGACGARLVLIEELAAGAAGDEADLPDASGPEDLAYVIYTSGSTGRPKGSLITQRNVLRLFDATAPDFRFGPEDAHTLFHSFAFDFSVWELWGALLYGGRLVVVPYWISRAPDAFHDLLRRERVTVLSQTPSAFAQLVQAEGSGQAAGELALRHVVFGGEALDVGSLRPWFERHGDERPRLVNMYGITETTVHVTYRPLSRRDAEGAAPSVVGRPLRDLELYVLDERQRLAPIGVPGELHVGGPGLGRGYLNRPELTAERFVPHPFSAEPGARLYRSGDLGRFRRGADGRSLEIEYLGRADHQVKIRGFRIELGEIEAELARHPDVQQALVLLRRDAAEGPALLAYVVPKGAAPEPAALRAHLARRLPDYMLPAAFVALPAFPLTEHGKIDRARLPAPAASDRASALEAAEPRSPTEVIVAGFFRELLGVDRVSVEDDFFELGGHSLLATQVVSRVRAAFHVAVSLRRFFDRPTVKAVAACVDEERRGGAARALAAIAARDPREPRPLSPAQERLWFFERLQPGAALYHVPAPLRLRGRLDVAALEGALEDLVGRHAILRTVFEQRDGRLSQRALPPAPLGLRVTDLADLSAERRSEALARRVDEAYHRPFDMEAGGLFRAELARLGPEEHVLVLTLHHVVCDGWSLGVLLQDLDALYRARRAGAPAALPELPLQYADYAASQREQAASGALDGQLAYWRARLAAPLPILELPADRPRPAVQTYAGARVELVIPPEAMRRVDALGRREGATRFMTLLGAFLVLLHRHTGETDLLVGCPVAGRPRGELEPLIGNVVNTLVLRTDASSNPTVRELLARVREAALGAFDHQDVPFEVLVDALSPPRDLRHSPLFQVAFGLQGAPPASRGIGDLAVEPVEVAVDGAKFDLTLSMVEAGDEVAGAFEYNADLFDAATARRMGERYLVLLEAMVTAPDARIGDLPMLPEAEARSLTQELRGGEAPRGASPGVHRLFERLAAAQPDAPAAVAAEGALTYAELDARSNQLARWLRARGVGAERRVGVALDPSLHLPLAVLGVWKAGGVYVPLDPRYPADRLAYMARDAGVDLVLTRSSVADKIPAGVGAVVCLDAEAGAIGAHPRTAPPGAEPDAAYLIYTSGSTGLPKGVLVRHEGLGHVVTAQRRAFEVGPGDRVLQFSSPCFDASVFEMVMALGSGAALHLAPREATLPGPDLIELLRARRISILTLPPSVLAALPGAELPDLRILVTAGEACSADIVERWGRSRRFFNAYGPTEATIWTTLAECRPDGQRPDIGRPIAHCEVFVLDDRQRLAPIGVPGELYVGGAGVARGYLGRPDLTADRFVPHPFGAALGERLYRTGDRVRFLPDGRLEFLGRVDRQVKVRGFRIEPGEVEVALRRHPAVREAVVAARPQAGEDVLVAYVVPHDGARPTAAELRAELRRGLPEHMVPSAFAFLAALPRMPSGKVDVAALPRPGEEDGAQRGQAPAAPKGRLQEQIAAIWCAVLELRSVGVDDNFFDVGGTSLRIVRVHERLRGELQADIALVELFQFPTIRELAGRIEAGRPEAPIAAEAERRAQARQHGAAVRERRMAIRGGSK
ncbi:MAG: amino acid adenylation domain-containing protein [Polyangiaceae bacterium]|nr:amino acid adenylation domain-containing protein [Polyangiaceae bacterium]